MRREPLDQIVNKSVNQTLGRTIITSGATFLAVLRAVSVRRRSAARLRVHDARRRRHRHLLDGVHRGGDRDHPEPADRGADARPAEGAGPAPARADRRSVSLARRGAARRRPGAHRVPAGVEFGASASWRALFFGLDDDRVRRAFDVACHVGHARRGRGVLLAATLPACCARCRSALSASPGADGRRLQLIVIGTVPIVIVGLPAGGTVLEGPVAHAA